MLSATPLQLRVQNNDSLENTWWGENNSRERKILFQQRALILPRFWATWDNTTFANWGYSPVMLIPTDEPKEHPKSIVTAYNVYRPIAETDRNSPNSLPLCFCLLSHMNCDFVEAVQVKVFLFLDVIQPVFYHLQSGCHAVFMVLMTFCDSSSHKNFLQKRNWCWSWWNDLPKVVWEVCSRTDFLPNPYSLPNHKVSVSATLSPLFHFPLPFQSASVRLTHVLFSPFFSLSADACGLGALLQASALRFLMVLRLLHPLLSWLSWL